jgi:hypothetical protein
MCGIIWRLILAENIGKDSLRKWPLSWFWQEKSNMRRGHWSRGKFNQHPEGMRMAHLKMFGGGWL